MKRLNIILLSVLFTAINAQAESGVLERYTEATQIGTVARRTFTNEKNQPVKIIYYRAKRNPLGSGSEDDIFPYEIRLFTYQNGKENWMGIYSEAFQIQRSVETEYNQDGQKQLMQWRDSDGIVRYAMLVEKGKAVSHIYFDDSGKKPIRDRGEIRFQIDSNNIKQEQ